MSRVNEGSTLSRPLIIPSLSSRRVATLETFHGRTPLAACLRATAAQSRRLRRERPDGRRGLPRRPDPPQKGVDGFMTVAPTTYGAVTEEVIAELRSLLGDENVLTDLHERAMRAFNCAPFPLHRWADQTPDVVVLPGGTDDVVGHPQARQRASHPGDAARRRLRPRRRRHAAAQGHLRRHQAHERDLRDRRGELVRHRRHRHQPAQAQRGPRAARQVLPGRPRRLRQRRASAGASAAAAGRSSAAATATSPTPSSAWSACCPTAR